MTEDFESFWSAYPRKTAKAEARKAWRQTEAIRPDLQRLLTAIADQCKTDQWQRHIIPHPATWLRGERWEDVTQVKLPQAARPKDRYDLANDEFNQRYGVKA